MNLCAFESVENWEIKLYFYKTNVYWDALHHTVVSWRKNRKNKKWQNPQFCMLYVWLSHFDSSVQRTDIIITQTRLHNRSIQHYSATWGNKGDKWHKSSIWNCLNPCCVPNWQQHTKHKPQRWNWTWLLYTTRTSRTCSSICKTSSELHCIARS